MDKGWFSCFYICAFIFFPEASQSFNQKVFTTRARIWPDLVILGRTPSTRKLLCLLPQSYSYLSFHAIFRESSLLQLCIPAIHKPWSHKEIQLNGDFPGESQILSPMYCSGISFKTMAEVFLSPLRSAPLGALVIIQIRVEPVLKSLFVSWLRKKLARIDHF